MSRSMSDLQHDNVDWIKARLGKLTASRFADAVARIKTGWGASRARYIGELVSERLTGEPYPRFRSAEMQRGIEMETQARNAYQFYRDVDIVAVGFIDHPSIAMSGCSPDGLVGDDGLVEFKCPATHTHIATLRGDPITNEYLAQVHWQMVCTERSWSDWVSFDPRLPFEMQMFIQRIGASDAVQQLMENDARMFLAEVDATVAALREQYPARRAA